MYRSFRYLMVILLVAFFTACSLAPEEEIPPIERDNLIGTWTADYSHYNREPRGVTLPDGKETLVLRADGTFEQDFQAVTGFHRKVLGKWESENVKTDRYRMRIHLYGAMYYLEGLSAATDPNFGATMWDPIVHQYVSIGSKSGVVILYATRLLWKSQSPCGRKYDLVLQHLPIGDLDAPTWVTFYRPCE